MNATPTLTNILTPPVIQHLSSATWPTLSAKQFGDMRVVKYTDIEQCQRTAIQVPPPPNGKNIDKYHYVIPMDSEGVRVVRVFKPGESKGELRGHHLVREHVESMEYPLDKAIKRFLHAGRVFGITQQAQAYLEGKTMKRKSSKKDTSTQRPAKILPRKTNGAKPAATTKKADGVCARVHAIAERLYKQKGNDMTRKEVIDACVAEKINKGTAATQYQKWSIS